MGKVCIPREIQNTPHQGHGTKTAHSILIPGESRRTAWHYSGGTGKAEAKKVIPISGRAETEIQPHIRR